MVEEVTSLKKDFKQKENKYLEEFLDMKALKEKNKVAIGYKNPLCLTRTQQVQPALYNGHEIIKTNHVQAIVHNSVDTLGIAEITRKKMNDKMKDPECVKNKVKIAPHDYSKENYLVTFTPQKQLTPEQIFWSNDLIKMKAESLKEQTTASQPIKALTVYPQNTPATLVPRVLPTKSEVKINIFALIQLFSEFKKTCKKRITPMGLTEGERGFEQTKECYLTEFIPFLKIIKEHFKGIQKALTKEIKETKDIFEELEAEVDQNVVNRKHDEIELKNLLIANDNLIADCLSKEVFYIATNSELTISRFTEMHEAHTIVQTRCLELEADLSKLQDKVQKDDHTELVKHFSNLEVNHLNLQLVPSSFAIFDLEPLTLSLDFVLMYEIFKSLSFRLDRLCHLVILYHNQHAHALHLLESSLIISLDRLDILKEDLFEHEHLIQRISLTGFPAQSVGSSNTDVLDLPCLLVLITGTSQSRQHESHHHFFPVDTSLIHIESRKLPTKSLFDVGSSRISIFTVNTLSITQMFWKDYKDNA
ncbi:hypothetical protein Tco_0053127 [Tanacetum coccineum]